MTKNIAIMVSTMIASAAPLLNKIPTPNISYIGWKKAMIANKKNQAIDKHKIMIKINEYLIFVPSQHTSHLEGGLSSISSSVLAKLRRTVLDLINFWFLDSLAVFTPGLFLIDINLSRDVDLNLFFTFTFS